MKRLTVLLIMALCWSTAHAQRLGLRNISIQSGLSQSVATALAQDRNGYVWIGTEFGLNRYNRFDFVTYFMANGLADNHIRALLELRDGRLLIGTSAGINQMEAGRIEAFEEAGSLITSPVSALFQDRDGGIWVGTDGAGVFHFNNDTYIQYDEVNGLGANSVRRITQATDGTLWFATANGLTSLNKGVMITYRQAQGLSNANIFDVIQRSDGSIWVATSWGISVLQNGRIRQIHTADGLIHEKTLSLVEDSFGGLWVGTESGISYFDATGIRNYTDDNGLSNNMVTHLMRDYEGSIWMGTYGGGVDILIGFKFLQYNVNDGLLSNMITSIAETKDGAMWISTYGGGIGRLSTGKISAYTMADGLVESRVYTLMTDRSDRLWIGTRNGISMWRNGRFEKSPLLDPLIHPFVRTIMEDRSGDIWVGTYGGGLARYRNGRLVKHFTAENGLPDNIVMKVLEGRSGNIWVATYGGVAVLEGDNIRTIHTGNGLVQNTVLTLYEDSRGWMWIGTFAGMTLVRDDELVNYTEDKGFPNPVCYVITEDQYGFIWVGTNRGLVRVDPYLDADVVDPRRIKDQLRFKTYTIDSGLLSDEMNANAVYKRADGSLWFGSVGGVIQLRPWFDQPIDRGPPVHLEQLRVFDGERVVRQGIRFKHDQNFIAFDFVGIMFQNPEGVTYEYRIRGIDQTWQKTKSRSVRYTTLPDGEYLFEVRARNADGFWSAQRATLRFVISPPFWKTWWFIVLILLGVAGSIAFVYNYYRIAKLVDMERIRIRIASDLHDDVGASLTEIALRADFVQAMREPDMMKDSVRQIGEMSRQIVTTMDDIVWSIDARNDTLGDLLDRMQDYASNILMHKGIETHFRFEGLDTGKSLPLEVRQNLYLILKEAVNNAAKHSRAGNMYINFIKDDRSFELSIRDDGVGLPDAGRVGSHGLRNMKMRAERIGAVLTFESTSSGLTIHVKGKGI